MTSPPENYDIVLNSVIEKISLDIRSMTEELWEHWSQIGLDHRTKLNYITRLVLIEKKLHCDIISETRNERITLQKTVDELKEEIKELSVCLSLDIETPECNGVMLCEYKKELENLILGYREKAQQRRTRMLRLIELESELAEKLGIIGQNVKQYPLPSEDDLDCYKAHIEALQTERNKRTDIFLSIQTAIKDIMDKHHIEPVNQFEREVVSSLSVDFIVSDQNMQRLAEIQRKYELKYESSNDSSIK